MKARFVAACVLGTLALAVATSAEDGASKEVRIDLDHPRKPDTKAAPANKTAPAAAAGAKKDGAKPAEAPPGIEGMAIARGDRGYLGLKIENGLFKMTFYDHDKKQIPPDVAAAVLRWPVHYQRSDERTLLTPSDDGKSLTSEKIVRPPYTFRLYITLLKDASNPDPTNGETYTVEFQQ
ncbi:MAG TPA: hypothetical protein VHE61_11325 [Opitutaceae bacterium]|nr:hypothetical protein [Opitutaceae bacterium]